jgi:hypothetical protein
VSGDGGISSISSNSDDRRVRGAVPAMSSTGPAAKLVLREVPTGGQNDDLGGVFVTSFGEGVHHVAPAFPENS